MDKDNIVDVDDYTEVDNELLKDKDIRKEPLYYTCVQVAKILEEPDSTIRYWSKVFQPVLNIKKSNNIRKYTKTDIENLLFIKKLIKSDGLNVKQALEYCSDKGFNNEEGLIDTSNPLAIKTFISAMSEHLDNKILEIQNNLADNIDKVIEQRNNSLKEDISITVDNVISDKMEEYSEKINNNINNRFDSIEQELLVTKKMNEKLDNLRQSMEARKEESEKEKKSFWNRLFNR